MIVSDEDLLELTADLATTALQQLSLNPAADVALTSCPQDRQPPSLHPDQSDPAWNVQNNQTSPWDAQSLIPHYI